MVFRGEGRSTAWMSPRKRGLVVSVDSWRGTRVQIGKER